MPSAEPERIKKQIQEIIGIDTTNTVSVSAKTGNGVEQVINNLISLLPPPKGSNNNPLRALLVDSWYDTYLGVMVLVRVVDGTKVSLLNAPIFLYSARLVAKSTIPD